MSVNSPLQTPPSEDHRFLMNTGETEILKYFTERRLRLLTLLASDVDKIKKFEMIKKTFAKALDF